MIRLFRLLVLFLTVVVFSFFPLVSFAQLSPGDLHEVHADLEGLENCEKCHEAGEQVSPDRCLNCHKFLSSRIADKLGFHGLNEYTDCVACHVEHLGRDSELIFWPDDQANFDHSSSGYTLEGRHTGLSTHCFLDSAAASSRVPPPARNYCRGRPSMRE